MTVRKWQLECWLEGELEMGWNDSWTIRKSKSLLPIVIQPLYGYCHLYLSPCWGSRLLFQGGPLPPTLKILPYIMALETVIWWGGGGESSYLGRWRRHPVGERNRRSQRILYWEQLDSQRAQSHSRYTTILGIGPVLHQDQMQAENHVMLQHLQ